MARYKTSHGYEDVGIPLILPVLVRKTIITDTETGQESRGLDWKSFSESDRKAWERLKIVGAVPAPPGEPVKEWAVQIAGVELETRDIADATLKADCDLEPSA